ncbi:MAG: hypothetical protein WCE87_16035, partial [Candidatus Udaeobacter sp.]
LTGDNNIDIGVQVRGLAGENNTIRIGDNLPQGGQSNCYIGGILDGAPNSDAFLVVVDDTGKLGTVHVDDTGKLGTFGTAQKLPFRDLIEDHKKVEQLEATVAALAAQLKERATQIQKLSAQVHMNKPATNVVLNNP